MCRMDEVVNDSITQPHIYTRQINYTNTYIVPVSNGTVAADSVTRQTVVWIWVMWFMLHD